MTLLYRYHQMIPLDSHWIPWYSARSNVIVKVYLFIWCCDNIKQIYNSLIQERLCIMMNALLFNCFVACNLNAGSKFYNLFFSKYCTLTIFLNCFPFAFVFLIVSRSRNNRYQQNAKQRGKTKWSLSQNFGFENVRVER